MDPLSGNGNEMGSSAGIVDKDDFALWRDNYGAMLMPGPVVSSAMSVPEPAAAGLMVSPA